MGFCGLINSMRTVGGVGHNDVETADAGGGGRGRVFADKEIAEEGAFTGLREKDFGELDGPVEAMTGEVGLFARGRGRRGF